MKKLLTILLLVSIGGCSTPAQPLAQRPVSTSQSAVDRLPNTSSVESAFSPEGRGEALIIKVINGSDQSIRLAAYSFTSPAIVKALQAAKKRGVEVQVLVDDRGNKGKSSIAALNLLVNAGIPTRTISAYAIHHDKYIVSDNKHVQTGSFNYSQAAAKSNSENVLVVWNNPDLAASYSKHWRSRWDKGTQVQTSY